MIRPFLKWPGGKFRLLDRILPHCSTVPARFVEVFAGSCAVYLNVPAKEALVNDVNPDLIALYSCLQKEGEAFARFMQGFFTAENNSKKTTCTCAAPSMPAGMPAYGRPSFSI